MVAFFSSHTYILKMLLSIVVSTGLGALIGTERARHGKAAGARTHVLVCLGGALTSMTSLYVSQVLGVSGDVFRISAQVISGVGFLGAGMIILHSNHEITNLTTAAGIWITGAIGVAAGYGFYSGAILVGIIAFIITRFIAKIEKNKKEVSYYVELSDMSKVNETMTWFKENFEGVTSFKIIKPLSDCGGHIGISIHIDKRYPLYCKNVLGNENILFITEE